MPRFKALQTAWTFDPKYDCERLVQPGEIIASDLPLDAEVAIPTGDSPDSSASKIFLRLPDES